MKVFGIKATAYVLMLIGLCALIFLIGGGCAHHGQYPLYQVSYYHYDENWGKSAWNVYIRPEWPNIHGRAYLKDFPAFEKADRDCGENVSHGDQDVYRLCMARYGWEPVPGS